MAKQLVFSDEARRSLIKGVDTLAKAVVTANPKNMPTTMPSSEPMMATMIAANASM